MQRFNLYSQIEVWRFLLKVQMLTLDNNNHALLNSKKQQTYKVCML